MSSILTNHHHHKHGPFRGDTKLCLANGGNDLRKAGLEPGPVYGENRAEVAFYAIIGYYLPNMYRHL